MKPGVIVTGGANGIGEACARRFAARGWRVVVADLDTVRGEAIAAELAGRFLECDVARSDDVARLAERAEADGPIDALVHVAGITHPMVEPEALSLDTYRRVLEVDLIGTFDVCRAIGTRMARRGTGSIVTIGSITTIAVLRLHAYGPAKAAVAQLTRQLAREWGPAGVRVNCISPGYVLTPGLEAAIASGTRSEASMRAFTVRDRLVSPDEIASVASFLCGPDASAITGQNLVVDAGMSISGHWSIAAGGPGPAAA